MRVSLFRIDLLLLGFLFIRLSFSFRVICRVERLTSAPHQNCTRLFQYKQTLGPPLFAKDHNLGREVINHHQDIWWYLANLAFLTTLVPRTPKPFPHMVHSFLHLLAGSWLGTADAARATQLLGKSLSFFSSLLFSQCVPLLLPYVPLPLAVPLCPSQ